MNPRQIQKIQRFVRSPSEAEPAQRLAYILAEMERAQADALADLADALDAPDVGVAAVAVEDRRDELLELAEAIGPGAGNPGTWYVEHRLTPPLDVEDADKVAAYMGMDADAWESQVAAWADAYRAEDDGREDYSDRQLAAAHLSRAYGAPSLEWWESEVVDVDTGTIIREALAGRMESIEAGIREAAEVADR